MEEKLLLTTEYMCIYLDWRKHALNIFLLDEIEYSFFFSRPTMTMQNEGGTRFLPSPSRILLPLPYFSGWSLCRPCLKPDFWRTGVQDSRIFSMVLFRKSSQIYIQKKRGDYWCPCKSVWRCSQYDVFITDKRIYNLYLPVMKMCQECQQTSSIKRGSVFAIHVGGRFQSIIYQWDSN